MSTTVSTVLSVSFGAETVRPGVELEEVLDRADRRMYEDKARIKKPQGGSGVITVDLEELRR